ncbi:MAG TPA: hypothetical protein VFS52_21110 [Steroidobacteraceae bacterium]|jgi:hypothetical protein|nr:hypothetical protein [Steroidobacteraceae bacterium]
MNTQVQDDAPRAVAPGSAPHSALAVTAVVALVLMLIAAGALALYLQNDRVRLQQQVLQQSTQMLELREHLTKVEIALQEKTAALATRDAALAEANKPPVPVRVAFRAAFMGQGFVATIRNATDGPLNVIAELREPGNEATRSVSLALDPNGTTEVGYAQGWTITSGQSITVAASGYRSVTAFAP